MNGHYFIVLEDSLIKFISKDLRNMIGEKNTSTYENVDKRVLFGEQFIPLVDNMIKNISLDSQKEWVTIPLLRKDGLIDLKRINFMWYPSV